MAHAYVTGAVTQGPLSEGPLSAVTGLKFQYFFQQGGPHFHFALGLTSYVAVPGEERVFWREFCFWGQRL